jgi:hypothetical protein
MNFKSIASVLLIFVVALGLYTLLDAVSATGLILGVGSVVAGGTVTQQSVTGGATYVETTEYLDMRDVERKVMEYKPYQTPLLTLLSDNTGGTTESWEHKYYAVDARGMSTTVTSATAITGGITTLVVADGSIFSMYNTVVFTAAAISGTGYVTSGVHPVGIVTAFPAANQITIKFLNNDASLTAATLAAKTIYRAGSAHNETAASTTPWGVIPETDYNYVQIFMEQVEQSEYQRLMKKEADWGFNDLKRMAIEDFKIQRERTFLAGLRSVTNVTVNGQTKRFYTCGGLINDTGIAVNSSFDLSDFVTTPNLIVPVLKTIFTGNNGSRNRFMLAGADFVEAMEQANYTDKHILAKETETIMGITFTKLVSTFGTLNISYYEQLDLLGKAKTALIIDKNNLYVTDLKGKGFNVRPIDYKSTGIANVDAAVIEQASTLLVKNKASHYIINAVA